MSEATFSRLLRSVFSALTLAAIAATLYTAFLRHTPTAFEPRIDGLVLQDLQLTPLPPRPGQADDEYAHSEVHRWAADAMPPGTGMLKLDLSAVHSREWMGFDVEQMARHTRLQAIDARREIKTGAKLAPAAVVSLGQSGADSVLQSCVVPGGVAHVAREELMKAVNAQRVRTLRQRVLELLGWQSNTRWECLLVSISMTKSPASEEALIDAWDKAYAALRERLPAVKQD